MKKYLVSVLFLLFLISCEDKSGDSDPQVTHTVNESFVNNEVEEDEVIIVEDQEAVEEEGEAPIAEEIPEVISTQKVCRIDHHRLDSSKIIKKVDILVVPDTSISIKKQRQDIANGFDRLLNSLPKQIDYNIGVVLAHGSKSKYTGKLYKHEYDPLVLKSKELSVEQIKTHLAVKLTKPKLDADTDGGEMGMLSLLNALESENLAQLKSQGIFREDAALVVVFISDEQDICAKYPVGVTPVVDRQNAEKKSFVKYCIEEEVNWKNIDVGGLLYTYKVTPQMVLSKLEEVMQGKPMVLGGVLYDENSMISGSDEDEIGYGYLELIRLKEGINIDLATGDYGDGLSKLGTLATASMNAPSVYELKLDYIEIESITAKVTDQNLAFNYDKESKAIVLEQDINPLSTVDISYCSDITPPSIEMITEVDLVKYILRVI